MSAYVYVDGLPNSIAESDVKPMFSTFGVVLSIHMGTTVEGRPMGIAQVHMAETQEADKAIHELHHMRFDGQLLLVFRDARNDDLSQ